jgi:hypothetical protein
VLYVREKVLRPHCGQYTEQFEKITGARADLIESWIQCTRTLCDKLRVPGSKHKVEEALRCIALCRLSGPEQAQVDEVRHQFESATRSQDEMAEKLARDFQTLMRMDCREPTTFAMRGPAIASILQGLQQNEALIPPLSRDSISYENAVGHLQRAIRDIEDPCIDALQEQNYRRCAQMSDCINRLTQVNAGEIDVAATDVPTVLRTIVVYDSQSDMPFPTPSEIYRWTDSENSEPTITVYIDVVRSRY